MKTVKYIRLDFEYILIYAKNKNCLPEFSHTVNKTMKFENPDNDHKGP